jgi:hypothetical protein
MVPKVVTVHTLESQHSDSVQVLALQMMPAKFSFVILDSAAQSLASHLSLASQHSDPSLAQVVHFVDKAFFMNAEPHVTALRSTPPFAHVLSTQHSDVLQGLALQVMLAKLSFGLYAPAQKLALQMGTSVRCL